MSNIIANPLASTAAKTPFWLWPNLLSLDAPLIAVVWQQSFASDLGVRVSLAGRAALALSVWFIYLLDRLLDTRSAFESPMAARHVFCGRRKRLCTTLACVALILLSFSVWNLPAAVVKGGFVLAGIVALYLVSVHFAGRNWLRKEAAVGVVFALGSGLVPFERASDGHAILFPALLFGVLCWLNSAAIEVWEGGVVDRVSLWSVEHMQLICGAVIVLALAAGFHGSYASLAIAASGYCLVFSARSQLSADALRVAIDVPLLAPLLWR